LRIASGSESELEYQLILADLGYLNAKTAQDLTNKAREVGRMLASLIEKVRGAHA
jgi:four helix bundle protein